MIWSNLDNFDSQTGLGLYKNHIHGHKCDYWDSGMCISPNTPKAPCLVDESIRTKTIRTRIAAFGDYKFKVSAIPVFEGKKDVVCVLYKVEDITEQEKMTHELVKAKEKAEQSDKLKSAFLANMSHEIRTPLNAIVGFSELLANNEDLENKDEYVKIIQSNNEQLLRLIGDVLDLSKIESGLIDLKYETFDLVGVFQDLYEAFQPKFAESKVQFLLDSPYAECKISLDKGRLIQVVSNFLTNAIKYTVSGHIKMGYSYENKGIKLYVEDTGIGIPKDKQERVFMRFEKLDSFAKGTGLGLSICKAIAKVKKGKIGCISEEGKGSTFWIWFPTTAEIKPKE